MAAKRGSGSKKQYSGKSGTEKLKDARQKLFDTLMTDIEKDGSSWVKEWSFPHPPMNGVTGKEYGPRNTAMLMGAMRDGGFRDPRFATFKMATEAGCHIIKGSHGFPVERWKQMVVDRFNPEARIRQPKTSEERDRMLAENPNLKLEPRCVGTYTVFNAEQMENTENLVDVEIFPAPEASRIADGLIKASPCPVHETMSDEAYYMPALDRITVPQRNQFTNDESFCRTLLHEQGHATGHPSRLNRPSKSLKADRKAYAFEELIAEMSCVFTANEIGLDLTKVDGDKPIGGDEASEMKNHAAYLRSWASEFKDPGAELLKAASRASAAADYLVEECFEPVLGKDLFRAPEKEVEGIDGKDMTTLAVGVNDNYDLEFYDVPTDWLEGKIAEKFDKQFESVPDLLENYTSEESVEIYGDALLDGVVENDSYGAYLKEDERGESLDEMMSAKSTEAEFGRDGDDETRDEMERE